MTDDRRPGLAPLTPIKSGTLGIPLHLRREPTPKDFADPRFDVIWELIKRVDVDFRNGLFSGATGNDVCAVLDALAAAPQEARLTLWQPIDTVKLDAIVVLWTPKERLYEASTIAAQPDHAVDDMRISTRRRWAWATHWLPIPAPPAQSAPQEAPPCSLCSFDDGLVQEWLSKARAVARSKGWTVVAQEAPRMPSHEP